MTDDQRNWYREAIQGYFFVPGFLQCSLRGGGRESNPPEGSSPSLRF